MLTSCFVLLNELIICKEISNKRHIPCCCHSNIAENYIMNRIILSKASSRNFIIMNGGSIGSSHYNVINNFQEGQPRHFDTLHKRSPQDTTRQSLCT